MPILFETHRLLARRLARADADALFALFGDPETMRFYGSGQPWSRDEVERMLDTYPFGDERLISEPGIALLKPELTVVAYGGVGYFRQGTRPPNSFSSWHQGNEDGGSRRNSRERRSRPRSRSRK